MGGLVDQVLFHILRIFEGPGQALFRLLPVLQPILLPGEFSLPAFPGPLLLLHPDPLDRGKVDPPPIAGHHRRHHAPVEAQGFALKLLFRQHPEPGDRVLLLRFRETPLCQDSCRMTLKSLCKIMDQNLTRRRE